MTLPDKIYFRPSEAAKLLSVHPATVKRWIFEGKLQATRTLGGHYRVPRGEVERVLEAGKE